MTLPRALVCPPTGPGSLGDEAMLEALAGRLVGRGYAVDAMPPFGDNGRWDHLPDIDRHVTFPDGGGVRSAARLVTLIRGYDRVYVLGADVLDGHYENRTLRRLLATASVARLLREPTTIVGFSYNSTPSRASVRAIRLLPPGIRILLRDKASLDRFRSAAGRRGELTSDVAFLLEPASSLGTEAGALESWIRQERNLGRTVVAFNAGGASYVPDVGQPDLDRTATRYAAELSSLLRRRPDVAVAVLAHDHRPGVGEHDLLRAVVERIDPEGSDRVTALVSSSVSAREVKHLVGQVDLVCTSRMHLAVAALGAGTPVVSIAYQGKFAGLYEHLSLEPLTLTHESSLEPGRLEAFLDEALEVADELRSRLNAALPSVKGLAERNLGLQPAQPRATPRL